MTLQHPHGSSRLMRLGAAEADPGHIENSFNFCMKMATQISSTIIQGCSNAKQGLAQATNVFGKPQYNYR